MSSKLSVLKLFKNIGIYSISRGFCSKSEKAVSEHFADPKIHNLLRLVTYSDPSEVHSPHFKKLFKHRVLMLTDPELQIVQKFASAFTHQRLQMPPVLPERNETLPGSIIIEDSKLKGLLPGNYKMVFTDINPKLSRSERLIVVRQPDGVLRHATASERDRMNLVYFPTPGRRMRVPLMFREPHFTHLLDQGEYAYVLDRACVQFEPNDPEYLRLCRMLYAHINARSWISMTSPEDAQSHPRNPIRGLRHTRHFGPLALHLICDFANPGCLVYEALSSQHYARLGWLLRLILLLRPSSNFAQAVAQENLPAPPPNELNANEVFCDQTLTLLKRDEAECLLSYVQLFVDREPLTKDQKELLMSLVEISRETLNADEVDTAIG